MGRLIEVKHILVDLECTDFLNYNDILLDLNLSPDALRIPIPRHLCQERASELAQRQTLLTQMNAKDFAFGQVNYLFPEPTLEEAVRIIQNNERGRHGRLRAKYMKDLRLEAQREKMLILNSIENRVEDSEKAAICIQRVFRGFIARRFCHQMRMDEFIFLGMQDKVEQKNEQLNKNLQNRSRRKLLQKQYEDDYLQALVTTKEKILRMEGPDMKEAIQDDFRQWYMEYKRINGKFPEFPEEEVWRRPDFKFIVEGAVDVKQDNLEEVKEKDGKKEKKDGKKDEEVEDPSEKFRAFADSEFLILGKKQNEQYDVEWKTKEEKENFAQKHDQEIIKANKRKEVEAEVAIILLLNPRSKMMFLKF